MHEQWIELDLDGALFKSRWKNCSDTAVLIGQAISVESKDRQQVTSMVSAMVNELMEVVFREGVQAGSIKTSICAPPGQFTIRIAFEAVNPEALLNDVREAQTADSGRYLQLLVEETPRPSLLSIMELILMHHVRIDAAKDTNAVVLTATFDLISETACHE